MSVTSWLGFGCPWLCAPDYPSTPFGTPLLWFVDSFRILGILASVLVLILTPQAISRCHNAGQQARFIAFGLWGMQVLTTNTEHFGDDPAIRTVINIVASAYALYGVISFLRWESPSESLLKDAQHQSKHVKSEVDPKSTS